MNVTLNMSFEGADIVAYSLRGPVRLQLGQHMYKKAGCR
jgi:hypothetical protein